MVENITKHDNKNINWYFISIILKCIIIFHHTVLLMYPIQNVCIFICQKKVWENKQLQNAENYIDITCWEPEGH